MKHQKEPKPTTNIASRWRSAMRDAKKDIRIADARSVRNDRTNEI